jgi:hypothetical protein
MKTLVAASLLFLLAGCSSRMERSAEPRSDEGLDVLRRYEAEFTPSDFDSLRTTDSLAATHGNLSNAGNNSSVLDASESMQGFRVQLLSTTNIDDATSMRSRAEAAFPDEWFYVEFDPPTYKLRAGNFHSRYDADRFARALSGKGFAEAWPVPARIVRNPPPPPLHPAPYQGASDTVASPR